ncbi:MAG TPA: A/G-specific adenine glycosylase [Acidobacteriaceae bacterium]
MKRADSGGDGLKGGRAPAKRAKAAKAEKPPKVVAAPGVGTPEGKRAKARLNPSPVATIEDVSVPEPDVLQVGFEIPAAADEAEHVSEIDPIAFRGKLMAWYGKQARKLPWRGATDPYHIWVSEIMLQQTRVAAVIEHYNEFVHRFPTLVSLALAAEGDVLAAWSGLGYYRRARMLHKAAQFIMLERAGQLPARSVELRTLPGIGEYTAAAIASIAFGEAVAVVDGNVERVILRLTGRPSETTAATRGFLRAQAHALLPNAAPVSLQLDSKGASQSPAKPHGGAGWDAGERIALAASANPTAPSGGEDPRPHLAGNPAGDHNQAMMELGATVCLPRAPLCLQCPVHTLCSTRGEHATPARAPQRSLPVAFLLDLRKRGTITEVLLEHRAADASLMPAMFELPPLPMEAVEGREPALRVRHAITNTNYYVQVFAPHRHEPGGAADGPGERVRPEAHPLRRAIPKGSRDLHWVNISRLAGVPITGLTRKILRRLHVMENPRMNLLD